MVEKVVGVVGLPLFTSFATPTYAGKTTAMELRLTTFSTAMHVSANCIRVICVQQKNHIVIFTYIVKKETMEESEK